MKKEFKLYLLVTFLFIASFLIAIFACMEYGFINAYETSNNIIFIGLALVLAALLSSKFYFKEIMMSYIYDNVKYFTQYASPHFKVKHLLFVTSQFGKSKVNVYAFGEYEK